MPSPEKKKRKEDKESDKLAEIENLLNDLRERETTVEKISRDDLRGDGNMANIDRPLVIKAADGKYNRCGISGDEIEDLNDELEVETFDGSPEEAMVWQGLKHPSAIAGDCHKVLFIRAFLVLFSLVSSFPKTFIERVLSHLFPSIGMNYRHVTVARTTDDVWRDTICKILRKGVSISHLDAIESARKISADKLNEAIDSFLNETCDPTTLIETVKSITREVSNCSRALGYPEEKSDEMDEKLKGIPRATRHIRAVHKRWTKEGGPAPDGDSMIEKVITAHRDKIEKNCARVVEKEAGSADVAIVADIAPQFIESLKDCLVIRVSNDPVVDDLPCLTLMATLSLPEKDELVEPSYLRIVAVKDGIPEDTDETKRIINNCGIGSIIVERVDLPNLFKDRKIFVDGFDTPCIKDLMKIVEPALSSVYCREEEKDKWRDYIMKTFRNRNKLN